ncbi:MAG: lamin tail domain-containing protein [Pseudomonadales bacterium]
MKFSTALKRFSRRIVLPTLLLSLSHYSSFVSAAIVPGDLLLTEVMANPAAVSDTNGEWFEVLNTTNSSIDIDGLVLRDNGSNQHTVNNGGALWIGAGKYFVFGRSSDTANNVVYQAD